MAGEWKQSTIDKQNLEINRKHKNKKMDKKPGGFQQQTIDRENMETNKNLVNKIR